MKDRMKIIKNIGLVFIFLLSLLVGGCGQSEQTTSQPQHSSVSQAESRFSGVSFLTLWLTHISWASGGE